MSYKYETHLHAINSSACAISRAEEYIPYYKSLGYDGIFVTDHFYNGNTSVDRRLPWAEWVRRYCNSYHIAKEAGEKVGLKVFFGWEITYQKDDYLIYGLSEEWLSAHPEVITWDQTEQYRNIKAAGGLVVQAHPFRERCYTNGINLHPMQCDAWETMNAGNEPYMNALAIQYAKKHHITWTVGSDIHKVGHLDCYDQPFAMVTEKPLNSEQDYVNLILSGTGYKTDIPERLLHPELHETEQAIHLFDADNHEIPFDGID